MTALLFNLYLYQVIKNLVPVCEIQPFWMTESGCVCLLTYINSCTVRFTMYFCSEFMEISKAIHFWKAYKVRSPKNNVYICAAPLTLIAMARKIWEF